MCRARMSANRLQSFLPALSCLWVLGELKTAFFRRQENCKVGFIPQSEFPFFLAPEMLCLSVIFFLGSQLPGEQEKGQIGEKIFQCVSLDPGFTPWLYKQKDCPAPAFQMQFPDPSSCTGSWAERPALGQLQRHNSETGVPMRKRKLSLLKK